MNDKRWHAHLRREENDEIDVFIGLWWLVIGFVGLLALCGACGAGMALVGR